MQNGVLNVIPSNTLKTLLTDVTEAVAKVLSHTFGPYGQNTLIQTTGSVYASKDGWNVLQMLRVSDTKGENAITINALKKLIQDVAQATLLNAGDGTTTSTLGAAYLNRFVSEYLKTHHLDARTIEGCLRQACSEIVNDLQEHATMINDDNMGDIIYRIALISTNWDKEISGIIRDIYCETKNPIIKVEDSGTLDTSVTYIDGYDIVGHLELPNFYLTSPASGLFEAKRPLILTFGSAIHKDKLQAMILMGGLLEEGRSLVLMAPTYDMDFLNTLKSINASNIQNGKKPANVVPFKYYAKTDIDKDCVEDFATATGGVLLTHEFEEVVQVFGRLEELVRKTGKQRERDFAQEDGTEPISEEDANKIIQECIDTLSKIGGTCEHIKATDKYILASGLTNKNEVEFERRKKNLENELEMKYKQYNAESSLTEMIRIKRLRLGKMQCNMGVIKVGGFGVAHLKSKKDSIDDATRACEVAYQDGYIMDGGMAIPLAAKRCIEAITASEGQDSDPEVIRNKEFVAMFLQAFMGVAQTLFDNKYNDVDKSAKLVAECFDKNLCFDLIQETFTDSLITPVAVCREILNGCLRLVLINATSNQFVFMNEDELIRTIQAGHDTEDPNEED